MRRFFAENALCVFWALLGSTALAWLGLYGIAWNDYEIEVQPAAEALARLHIGEFLRVAPIYGGSLIERAPFALLPSLWHGGSLAVYRMLALPCLLAGAALGVLLVSRMRAAGRPRLARGIVLGVCVANPVTLIALELGHPEELLGAVLCIVAVLLASVASPSRRQALLAGALLGLAIANKQWAVLAAAPVLLALPGNRRAICAASAFVVALVLIAPLLLGSSGGYAAGAKGAVAPGSTIFQPWQIWWFFGAHGHAVHGLLTGVKPGYRAGPAWAGTISHPLILLAGALIAVALWWHWRGTRLPLREALLALAVTLLARSLLDTWDTFYYLLPALLALAAWESESSSRQPPVIALALSLVLWGQSQWLGGSASPDLQSAIFISSMLPLTVALGVLLFRSPGSRRSRSSAAEVIPGAQDPSQPITVRSLGSPVSTSQPSSRTTVRSSMRTPSVPGR
ncbi:MAG TPA: hypothetical protein VH061_02370 [Solirubrobacteraceae bacterium]|jgi:hypothetical protein|nr:hypothetical protein [Solirubrobacteraceae bacterium]